MAITVERIIMQTLIVAAVSSRSKAPNKGFIRPTSTTKVKRTATCAITLFSFFTPGVQISSTTPINVGISAVIDGVWDAKYPQEDNAISMIALIKFAMNGFI